MTEVIEKKTRKFKEQDYYSAKTEGYYLLPFRFFRMNARREIMVNEVGDYLIVDTGVVQRVIQRQINRIDHPELYGDLIADFFISEEKIHSLLNVLSTRYRTKKSFLDNFTSLHIFVISLRCEHTCHYCQVSRVSEDKSSFDMRREHIEKGVGLMMMSPNPHVTMEFQGGEALLAFENIKYAVSIAKVEAVKHQKKITFVICTNLAPLNDDILSYCLEHEILISTSLDGPEFIHNKNRHKKGNDSHKLAVTGINRCRQILGEGNISALLTTSNLSLDHPEEIIHEYLNQGFNSIFLRPISPYGFAVFNEKKNRYETNRFLEFYKKALNLIIEINLEGRFFREDYATIILKKILSPFPVGYVDLQSPAGMINNVIVFNYNGKIYASDEARMLAEMKDETFLLGDLDHSSYNDIFYGDKAVELAEAWSNESLSGCSECAFQSYCGSDPVINYATQGDVYGYRPTSVFCQKNMEIIRHLFELIDGDPRIEKIFHSWIRN